MKYEYMRNIAIVIIIICLLLILFRPQIKRLVSGLFDEGFATTVPSTTPGATTSTSFSSTTTTSPSSITKKITGGTTEMPKPTPRPDISNITYDFVVGGYNPLLDLVVSRMLLKRVWDNQAAEMYKTGITRPSTTNSVSDAGVKELFVDIESATSKNELYPMQYATFEEFFVDQIQCIPRLNIFVYKEDIKTNPTPAMNILVSKFAKPDWVLYMTKFFGLSDTTGGKIDRRTIRCSSVYNKMIDKPDLITLAEYLSEINNQGAEDRESNTSNNIDDTDLSNLSTITMPTKLRELLELHGNGELSINLSPSTSGKDGDTNSFTENTISLIRFITSQPALLSLLYFNPTDKDTLDLINVPSEDLKTTDNLEMPKLLTDLRMQNGTGYSFAQIVGYSVPNGVKYNINLITDKLEGDELMKLHSNSILDLARRAFLQNQSMKWREYIPDALIQDKITGITDNMYYYYFNVLAKGQNYKLPMIPMLKVKKDNKLSMMSDIQTMNRILRKIRKHAQPIYDNLPDFDKLESDKKYAIKKKTNEPKLVLQLRLQLEKIKQTRMKMESQMPVAVYLPIYDFQYVKIIPALRSGNGMLPMEPL